MQRKGARDEVKERRQRRQRERTANNNTARRDKVVVKEYF